jgi:hypothetical protein
LLPLTHRGERIGRGEWTEWTEWTGWAGRIVRGDWIVWIGLIVWIVVRIGGID